MNADKYQIVHDRYSDIARNARDSTEAHEAVNAKIAATFGYTADELQSVAGANLGLSCGAPVAQAKLKKGEVVVDLGSGGGIDVFLAAKEIGPEGKAIGVDMSDEMLTVANRNAAKANATNVSFVKSQLPKISLPSSEADCIVSNCVINLIPHDEKPDVFMEMFRVLRPGGRVVLSDILARKPLPEEVRGNVELYVGCIAGASQVQEYKDWLMKAGFQDVAIIDSKHDLNIYKESAVVNVPTTKKDDCHCCAACETKEAGGPCACDSGRKIPEEHVAPSNVSCCAKPNDSAPADPAPVNRASCCGKPDDSAPADPAPVARASCCGKPGEKADVPVVEKPLSCCSPHTKETGQLSKAMQGPIVDDLNEWVGSFMVFAVKAPAASH